MSNFVFNIAKGRVAELAQRAIDVEGGAEIGMLALGEANNDATLKDFDTVAALLGDASTTEANFTNYARKVIAAGNISRVTDDSGDLVKVDITVDPFWTNAGGTLDDTLTDVVFYFDPTGASADSALIPLTLQDFIVTTDGTTLTVQIDSNGIYGAS